MNGLLKVIAVITMVIDHTGLLFFPQTIELRLIGRLSLPIFAWCIAEGYRYTSDVKKYFFRLAGYAILSQVPYFFIFPTRLNILFSFAASLLLLYLKDRYSKWLYLLILPGMLLKLEYGIYAMVLVIIFHEFQDMPEKLTPLYILSTLGYCVANHTYVQLFSITALPLISVLKDAHIKIPRMIFYWFYPVQWAVLVVLRGFILMRR